MKTLKDELKELQILLNNPTPENEMLYQKKFIEIPALLDRTAKRISEDCFQI